MRSLAKELAQTLEAIESTEIERSLEEKVEILTLTKQAESHKRQLKDLLNIWHHYQTEIKQKLMFTYDNLFGQIEDEIYDKKITAELLEKKYFILSYKAESEKRITQKDVEFIDDLLKRAQLKKIEKARLRTSYKLYQSRFSECTSDFSNLTQEIKYNNQYDLTALYRLIVKQLHPDLAGNSVMQRVLWDNLQNCYKQRDLERIKMFYLAFCHDTRFNIASSTVALERFISELKDCINKQKQTLTELKSKEPFCFEDKLTDKNWVISHKNKLRQEIQQTSKTITNHKLLIDKIIVYK